MKKLLTIIALTISTITMMAEEFKIGKLTFEITSPTTIALKSAEKDITKVYLGKTVDYQGKIYTLTEFGYRAFCDCSSLTSVTIPNSVTEIGNSAFSDCSSLTSVTIPNSVTEIGMGAFYGCTSLTSVTIPYSVTHIDASAFSGCSSLKSVTIPNSVTEIGYYAFSRCSALTSVTIPNSVKSIRMEAFSGCKSLTSMTIPNSVTEIEYKAFRGCSSLTSINIPNSVTEIDKEAFYGTAYYDDPSNWENGVLYIDNCLIKLDKDFVGNCTIKENTHLIADGAFQDCSSLKSVTIPNSVTSIGDYVFYGCTSLTSVTIPNSVKSIGDNAFSRCSALTSMTIPNSVKRIRMEAFSGCKSLTSMTIPNSVTEIEYKAFRGCSSLTSVTIPKSVTRIGWDAFEGTAFYDNPSNWENGALYINDCLIEVDTSFVGNCTIKENTHLIADGAFEGCSSLTSVTIPNSIKIIGDVAFSGCKSLTSVTIPDGVTSIGNSAFRGCTSLQSIKIPNSVTEIGWNAFGGCSSLTRITVDAGNTHYDSRNNCNAIIETGTNTLIAGCKNTTIPNSVTTIGDWAFFDCSSLTSVTIPNSVKSIGNHAFQDCSSLKSITIPNSVTEIGWGAFQGCTSLTSVTILNSVTEIKYKAFCGCTSLRYITIPKRLEPRGRDLFCDSFDSATIHYTETDSNNNNSSSSKGKTEEEPLIIRKVQLQEDGETYSVPAVEGQLVIMFDEDMSHEESTKILEKKGLSIISSIPELNYYLIQVPVGEEGQYFSQLNDNDLVDYVYPNTIEYFCSASAYALDDYKYTDHGSRVSKMLTGCDSMMDKAGCDPLVNLEEKNVAFKDVLDNNEVKAANWKITEALDSILFSHFSPSTLPASSNGKVVINLSIGTALFNKDGKYKRVLWNDADVTESNRIDYRRSYVNSLKRYINLVKKFDEEDFVIVKGASNEGMKQLETIIDELTSELTWDELKVFERHFILVSAKDDYGLVDYPTDVSRYHKMVSKVDISDVTRQDTAWRGTSFSSPRLAGYIYKLAEKYDLPATTVLRFVRSATEKAIDNVVTYELIEQEITNANRIETGFVDLGLPSGTLWKAINEPGLYTYQEANDKFANETEQLPTYEQLFELKQECQWGRTDTGYELLGPNGNSITFSAEGYVDCGGTHHYANGGAGMFGTETIGMIWSSTPTDADKAYSMGIGTYNAGTIQSDNRCYGRSVHLVQSVEKEIEKEEENVADNIITYTSSDGDIINPKTKYRYGGTIVSNTYENGKGTIVFDRPVTSIRQHEFSSCSTLTSVTLPNGVKEIESGAFYNCSSLTSITIPNSVTRIDESAFMSCESLTSITIPNSVTRIASHTFQDCHSLTSMTIPNSVMYIDMWAFFGCKSLTSVTILNSKTSIDWDAFPWYTEIIRK